MTATLDSGSLVYIPCRSCGARMLPFTIQLGLHRLSCPDCDRATQVDVREELGLSRVRTQEVSEPPG